MPKLFLATSNPHKTLEVRQLLGEDWEVRDLGDYPALPIPEETGETFEENAILKAESASRIFLDDWVLADDSGLEVDALALAPGVRSARYAGASATDADNRERLKAELALLDANLPATTFTGRFRCSMALAYAGKTVITRSGCIEGHLLLAEQGAGGFGYDPLFVPEGHSSSFGVLSPEIKNRLSHRARALTLIVEWLRAHSEHRF